MRIFDTPNGGRISHDSQSAQQKLIRLRAIHMDVINHYGRYEDLTSVNRVAIATAAIKRIDRELAVLGGES